MCLLTTVLIMITFYHLQISKTLRNSEKYLAYYNENPFLLFRQKNHDNPPTKLFSLFIFRLLNTMQKEDSGTAK